jgi:hypothetical protein
MEHIKPPNEGLYTTDQEHGYEKSDVNIRAILGFGIFLFVSGVVIHLALWGFYRVMENYNDKSQAPANPMAQKFEQTAGKTAPNEQQVLNRLVSRFPQPRLQVDDVRDMNEFRGDENRRLNNYVWLDKNAGRVSIPIERAMQIVAERGLPNFGTSAAAAKTGPNQPQANQVSQPPVRAPQTQR